MAHPRRWWPMGAQVPAAKSLGWGRANKSTIQPRSLSVSRPRRLAVARTMCHLVLFRHVQKTGGTSVRALFERVAAEPDGWRGRPWRASVPYSHSCTSFHSWRRTLVDQWLADRARDAIDSRTTEQQPNLFIEYHVGYDGAHFFYSDLAAARAVQTARCRVLAVALVRRPEAWIRSMFRHDLQRYADKMDARLRICKTPPCWTLRDLGTARFSHAMCDLAQRVHAAWGALGASWPALSHRAAERNTIHQLATSKRHADIAIRRLLAPRLRSLGVSTLPTDDETTNHTNSQTNAMLWRIIQLAPAPEAYAFETGARTSFDVVGTTEHMDAFVSEIFRATGHAHRPPLEHRNAISTDNLHIARAATEAPACAAVTAALSGAPDEILDRFAQSSERDLDWWKNATRDMAEVRLLPVHNLSTAAFRWTVLRARPRNRSVALPAHVSRRWDAVFDIPENLTHMSVCVRVDARLSRRHERLTMPRLARIEPRAVAAVAGTTVPGLAAPYRS